MGGIQPNSALPAAGAPASPFPSGKMQMANRQETGQPVSPAPGTASR